MGTDGERDMTREEMFEVASRIRKEGYAIDPTSRADAKRKGDLLLAARVVRANANTIDWIEEARPTMCYMADPADFYPWNDILKQLRVEP